MGKLVTPQVFLIGYTTIDTVGLDTYLKVAGCEDFLLSVESARQEGLSDGEILCSLYAKLCYKSLVLGQNLNVSRLRDIPDNLRACWDQGHGSVFEHVSLNFVARDCSRVFCYDPETEVYTASGWKPMPSIAEGEEILTFNSVACGARWSPVLSMHSFFYDGDVFGWANSQMVSPLMTPDHTLWLAWHDLRRARGLSSWENVSRHAEKVPVSEAYGKRFVVRKDIPWHTWGIADTVAVGRYEYHAVDLFSWLGWMATDGCFCKDRASKCSIMQSKPAQIAKIRALMDRLFSGRWRMHGPHEGSDLIQFTIYDRELADFARDNLGENKAERHLSRWLIDAGTVPLRAFLDAAIDGDGLVHKTNGHKCLYTPSRHAAGQYQVIAAMLAMPANMRTDDRVGESHEIDGKSVAQTKPGYVVDFSRRGGGTLVKPEYQFQQRYSGLVYCPKTSDGVIFVRKAGHPFWCGNTHEIVRHRAGLAFSQTSGRYVRGDTVDIVFDPILDPVRHLVEAIQEIVEQRYRQMVTMMGLDNMKDFDLKKKITSALRRVLPNGQSNEIGFSINLRALRHVIQLRTSRHAEWEIREVFGQVYRLVKDRYPLVFHGAVEEVVGGLVEVSGMKMQPYEK